MKLKRKKREDPNLFFPALIKFADYKKNKTLNGAQIIKTCTGGYRKPNSDDKFN
jgi:hypothetical protein